MKLIGAGLPRTGTLTQKVALEQLGLGSCYHWVDVLADLDGQVPRWNRALDGEAVWEAVFAGRGRPAPISFMRVLLWRLVVPRLIAPRAWVLDPHSQTPMQAPRTAVASAAYRRRATRKHRCAT